MKVSVFIVGIFGFFFSPALFGAVDDAVSKNIRFEEVIPGEDLTACELLLKNQYLKQAAPEYRSQVSNVLEKHWALYTQWIHDNQPIRFKIVKVFDQDKLVGFFSFSLFEITVQGIAFYENHYKRYSKPCLDTELYIAFHASPLLDGYEFAYVLGLQYLKSRFPECQRTYASSCSFLPEAGKKLEALGFKEDKRYICIPAELAKDVEGIVGYSRDL